MMSDEEQAKIGPAPRIVLSRSGGTGEQERRRERGAGRSPSRGQGGGEKLARSLGWLSLGLGVVGIAAPRSVARWIGVGDDERSRAVLRAVGMREVATGIGILSQPRAAGWLWSRVAGDLIDLALLSTAFQRSNASSRRVATTTAAIAGVTAMDLVASRKISQAQGGEEGAARVAVTTIYRPIEEVYGYWRNLENLSHFMTKLKSVQELGGGRSRWQAEGPAGTTVEWDAEIVDDRPNELIAWRSLPDSAIHHCGQVRFQRPPHREGTEVRVEIEFAPPGGPIGELVARIFGKDPGQQIKEDLRTFKTVLETGAKVVSEGTVGAGPRFPQHPAQPPEERELAAA